MSGAFPSAAPQRAKGGPPKGLDAFVNRWAGAYARRRSQRAALERLTEEAVALTPALRALSDRQLAEETALLHQERRRGRPLPWARQIAAVAEVARRVLGLEAHREQLLGALATHAGFLAEMATGEGKTLTIGLAAALGAWRGRPVHVLTANDYLAGRDAAWLEPFYARCGLSVGSVLAGMPPPERREGYARELTYSTQKEVVADFLRDRLAPGHFPQPERRRLQQLLGGEPLPPSTQRPLYAAIVDEADNALIDEAVTPLIISQEEENAPLRAACAEAERLARDFLPGRDYAVNRLHQELSLTPGAGERRPREAGALEGVWRSPHRREELLRQALVAREFFHLGKQYVIEEGAIVIVDEFTGRLMPDRKWKQGLHQAIEAKEGLEISAPTETLARLSFQRFFRLYPRLGGLTGTAAEEADEFWQSYGLPVLRIPTHRPCVRRELPEQVFATAEEKWEAVVDEIAGVHRVGRPVLVGTRTVAASERLAQRLSALSLPFNLLNARQHREEARIVAEAGEPGRITIATNMAGRGTDITLGRSVAAAGGLHVIATERHEARRIDRQLFGRCARQGDPGSARAFVSLEDELLVRHTPAWLRRAAAAGLGRRLPGSAEAAGRLVRRAQAASERMAARRRRGVLEMDERLDETLAFAGARVEQ